MDFGQPNDEINKKWPIVIILALYNHTKCYRVGQYFNMYEYCQYREIRSRNNGIADISQVNDIACAI